MAPDAPSPLGVKTINHITLVVKDLEASTRFYRDVLGMRQVDRPAFPFLGRWFQAGATLIHMNVESLEAGRAGVPYLDATHRSRGFHFAFEVEDCDAAAELLARQGVEIDSGPKSRPDGARQLYLLDPDGHQVEIFSETKKMSQELSSTQGLPEVIADERR